MMYLSFLWINLCFGAGKPHLRRACVNLGTNSVSIQWIPFGDTCIAITKITFFGFDLSSGVLKKVDSINWHHGYDYLLPSNTFNKFQGKFFLQYQVDCGGPSVLVSDTITLDTKPAPKVNFDSLSVNNGRTVMGWKPSSAVDAKAYVIYRSVGAANNPFDTVYGKNSTFYMDSINGRPDLGSLCYRIAVLDSCDNISILSTADSTVYLSAALDTCKRTMNLRWTKYFGWAVDHYGIFYSVDMGQHWQRVSSNSGYSFSFKNAMAGKTYLFYVRAYKSGDTSITSTSNISLLTAAFNSSISFFYLRMATVADTTIRLSWAVNSLVSLSGFDVEMGSDSIRFSKIGHVGIGSGKLFYYDVDGIKVQEEKYYFRIKAIDGCGNIDGVTTISPNIVLGVEQNRGYRFVQWNKYSGWVKGVKEYILYRNATSEDSSTWVKLYSGLKTEFNDFDSVDYDNYGICYRLIAVPNPSDSILLDTFAASNIFCLTGPPVVWFPNAFVPYGLNSVFVPVTKAIEVKKGRFEIYNRWGQRIYESDDIVKGWDGLLPDGSVYPVGIYFYHYWLYGLDKRQREYKGTVMLLR